MEYVFGTRDERETLQVKSAAHTDLTGFHQLVREYPDQTITDHFRVVRRLDSREDAAGNCYDWYEIDRHYRVTDKTGPLVEKITENAATTEDAICELDAGLDQRMTAIEDALCELDELMSMGGEAGE